jgi:hypothetical protein
MVFLELSVSAIRIQARKTKNLAIKSFHQKKFSLKSKKETNIKPILKILRIKLKLLSKIKKPLFKQSLIERTRKSLSSRLKLTIKRLKITIDMTICSKARKKWKE